MRQPDRWEVLGLGEVFGVATTTPVAGTPAALPIQEDLPDRRPCPHWHVQRVERSVQHSREVFLRHFRCPQ